MTNSLIERLLAAHRLLGREIVRERARPWPDGLRLARLKKERLAVKDRLARYLPDAAELRRVARAAIADRRLDRGNGLRAPTAIPVRSR